MSNYIFGPVPSRRLGRSLGVDLVPFKTCSYDCVYCQLGRTTCKTAERKEWVTLVDVVLELKDGLSVRPDYITLSGSGELTDRDRVYAVLGGMHLVRATTRRLEATVAALKRYGVQRVGTAHCTGMRAATHLRSQLPGECFECSVGSVFTVQNGTDNIR